MGLENFVLNPATLLVLIFGLVEYVKGFGLRGNALRLASMALGMALAVAFKLREVFPAWASWIELVFFGLAAGLAASGVYDFLKDRWKGV
jgi:ABC-type iron transport system FetAB permease component